MNTLAVIPARFASTRFPGKPLIDIDGKSMIQRVYEQVSLAEKVKKAIVATDDKRIFDHVINVGGEVMMTSSYHQSGTDRCAEIASQFTDYELVINVQGDEPFIKPQQIDDLVNAFINQKNTNFGIGTMIKQIVSESELFNANIVKVVKGINGKALYFSRQAIPHLRGIDQSEWLRRHSFFKHIGMYIFRSETLLEITKLPVGILEKAESLEQLRWLENGYSIFTVQTDFESFGIDTPEDLAHWQKMQKLI